MAQVVARGTTMLVALTRGTLAGNNLYAYYTVGHGSQHGVMTLHHPGCLLLILMEYFT